MKKSATRLAWIPALLLAAAAILWWRPAPGAVLELFSTSSRTADLDLEISENGVLEAASATHITAPDANADRKLIEIAEEGRLVSKGDLLAKFDTSQLEELLTTLQESGLEARRTDAELEAGIRLADLNVARQTAVENARLAEITYRSMTYNAKLERDAAETRLNNARNEIQVATNRVAQEENRRDVQLRQIDKLIADNNRKIEQTKANIASFAIHAPEEGIVVYPPIKISGLTRKVQVGDQLFKGQIFLIIPNLYKMNVLLDIPEEEIRRIQIGLPALVVTDAFPNNSFTGEVASIAPLAHVRDNNPFIKAFRIVIRIQECDLERLRPGMNARVTIRLASYKAAHIVPVPFLQSLEGKDFVWIENNGRLERQPVRVLDAGRTDAVVEEPVGGRLVLPGAALRDHLATPSRPVRWREWSPR
jgi:multidrug efflux pump subunit AcrA (membrane-fusion protein)